MPSVKTHDQIALLSIIPTFYVGHLIFDDIGLAAILTLSTLVSALVFSPDLDTNSVPYKRWGLLRHIWVPYNKLVSHRSTWSHSFIKAPVFKIVYLAFIAAFFAVIYLLILNSLDISKVLIQSKTFIQYLKENYILYIIAILGGFFWANAQHVAADRLCTSYKKMSIKL